MTDDHFKITITWKINPRALTFGDIAMKSEMVRHGVHKADGKLGASSGALADRGVGPELALVRLADYARP